MKKYSLNLWIVIFLMIFFASCKKEAGEGGSSSIYGKVYVKDYNSTFTVLQEEYYGAKEDVYIIYGDDKTYSDHVNTNYDGTFEFKYLRKGTYHIYAYTKDSTMTTNSSIAVIRDVEITKNNQEVEVPEIVVYK